MQRPHERNQDASSALPLGVAQPGGASPGSDLPSEADIRTLVDSFYDVACRDELLGPVFNGHIADWSAHLPKMYDFWSAVALRTGRYSGRPFEAHQGLPELSPAHFARWLELWEATVARVIAAPARESFILSADRMAASMSHRLFGG
jgi:hemoglobin